MLNRFQLKAKAEAGDADAARELLERAQERRARADRLDFFCCYGHARCGCIERGTCTDELLDEAHALVEATAAEAS